MAMKELAKPIAQIQDVPPLARAFILALPELEDSLFKPYLSRDYYTSTLSEALPIEYNDNLPLIDHIYHYFNNSSQARVRSLCTMLNKSNSTDLERHSRSLVGELIALSGLTNQGEYASRARQELMKSPGDEKRLPSVWQLSRFALTKIVVPPAEIH